MSLNVGDRLVLEPEGIHGRVEKIWEERGVNLFVFTSDIHRATVQSSQQRRWRGLLSSSAAHAIEEQIASAKPIDSLSGTPNLSDPAKSALVWETLDLYLEGSLEQRITAYATLLNWQHHAKVDRRSEEPWRGRLSNARDFLLGELALVAGVPYEAMLERLARAWASAKAGERVVVGSTPTAPRAPKVVVPDPGWTPGPAATHELGSFRVEGSAAVLTGGWSLPGPALEFASSEDCFRLSLRSGEWNAKLIVQEEGLPPELKDELLSHQLDSQFEVTFHRTWLLFAHPSTRAGTPRPRSVASVVALSAAQEVCDELQCDAVESIPFVLPTTDSTVEPLTCIGHLEPWTHRVALVLGDELSREASAALRTTAAHLAAAWDWGFTLHCGRYGRLPILAAGPESSRTIIAIPGAV